MVRIGPGSATAQVGHDRNQVLQGLAEAIQGGDHEGVASTHVVQARGQLFALGVLAGKLPEQVVSVR